MPTVSAVPTVNPVPAVWEHVKSFLRRYSLAIILGALAATAVVYLLVPPFKVHLVPFKDYGEQQIVPPGPLAFALELCPVRDPGDQKLEKVGPLVAAGGGQWTSKV